MLFRPVEVERLPRGPVPPRNPFQAWAGSALPSGGRLRLSVRRRGLFSAAPGVVPERERAGFRGKSGAFLHGSRRITFAVAIVKRPAVMERCRPALLRRFFREERAAEGSSAEKFRCRKILPSEDPTVGRPAGAASSAGQRFRRIRAASSAGRPGFRQRCGTCRPVMPGSPKRGELSGSRLRGDAL